MGELNVEDLGLELIIGGVGEGECRSRLNGLFRCLGPLETDIDMPSSSFSAEE